MTRDTFNNSGINYGHMGPVNIGKQRFDLTSDIVARIMEDCPTGIPVEITAIGGHRAMDMATILADILAKSGYSVEKHGIMMRMPPPRQHVTVERSASKTYVQIAPEI